MRKSKIEVKEMVRLYGEELWSMQRIADLAGVSGVAVSQHIKNSGCAYRGGPVTVFCLWCKGSFKVPRSRAAKGGNLFCSPGCYHKSRIIDTKGYSRLTKIMQDLGRGRKRHT